MLTEFIGNVKTLYSNDPVVRGKIPNYEGFLSSLQELNVMEGMENFKNDITSTIKTHLITNDNTERGRHNTIILGPPGCGKTTLAKVVAKIYSSLGFVKDKKMETSSFKAASDKIKGIDFMTGYFIVGIVFTISVVLFSIMRWYYALPSTVVLIVVILLLLPSGGSIKNTPPPQQNNDNTNKKHDPKFAVLKRHDLVSEYLGQSAPKTVRALTECLGKVIFIDEAYALINSSHSDPYGREVLNTLIQFMDDHQDECLFIFGGYKEDITRNLYSSQRGLERRFPWIFSIEKYTPKELFNIFKLQLPKYGLFLSSEVNEDEIIEWFSLNDELFPFSGGDTEVLVTYSKQLYASHVFDKKVARKENEVNGVTSEMIATSMKMLARSRNKKVKFLSSSAVDVELGNPKKEMVPSGGNNNEFIEVARRLAEIF